MRHQSPLQPGLGKIQKLEKEWFTGIDIPCSKQKDFGSLQWTKCLQVLFFYECKQSQLSHKKEMKEEKLMVSKTLRRSFSEKSWNKQKIIPNDPVSGTIASTKKITFLRSNTVVFVR